MTWEEVAILDHAQATYRKYCAEIHEYQRIVAQLEHNVATLQRQLAVSKKETIKAVANSKGVAAQMMAIVANLQKSGVKVPLQEPSGHVWPKNTTYSGKPMSQSGAVYLQEVHKRLEGFGIKSSEFSDYYI
jgi:hypothetical protein